VCPGQPKVPVTKIMARNRVPKVWAPPWPPQSSKVEKVPPNPTVFDPAGIKIGVQIRGDPTRGIKPARGNRGPLGCFRR